MPRISARPIGHRGRMASKPGARAKTGRRSRAAEHQGAERHLLAPSALCARVEAAPARKERVACSRDEFRCPRLRANLEKTPQYYSERHDRGAIRLTARVDTSRAVGMHRRPCERSKIGPQQFISY